LIRATGDNINAFTAPVIGTTSGAFGSALTNLGSWKYPTWGVALNVTYPIGYSAAKAEAARAEILAKEAAAQQKALEVQVVNDVTAAAIQVRNAFDEIGTTRQAANMAARRLDAEQKKFAVGLSTNYLIVQAERDLGDARRAVLQAEIAYQNALVDFDRAQQTTLQSAGVTIVTPAGIGTATVGSGRPAQAAPSGSFF
jgi:outer membrane protein TolC